MATDKDICQACDDLKKYSPDFVQKGITDTMCQSLMNNTGLNPKANHDNCEDLHDLNDCLIAGVLEDIPSYDDCDWKAWAEDAMKNLLNVLDALICSDCGQWDEINRLWNAIKKLQCLLDSLTKPTDILVGKENIKLGPDVQWRTQDSDGAIAVPRIYGNNNCAYITGAINLGDSWLDRKNHSGVDGYFSDGGWLVYEYRIKKSDYDLKWIQPALMSCANMGTAVTAHLQVFNEGQKTWGYKGAGDSNGSTTVPDGYIYAQVRMMSALDLGNGKITLCGTCALLKDITAKC